MYQYTTRTILLSSVVFLYGCGHQNKRTLPLETPSFPADDKDSETVEEEEETVTPRSAKPKKSEHLRGQVDKNKAGGGRPQLEPPREPEPSPQVIYPVETELDFESIDIAGELAKPQGSLLLERSSQSFGSASANISPSFDQSKQQKIHKQVEDSSQMTEEFTDYGINPFVKATKDKLSTFSIDVDTASYTIGRRKLTEGFLPPYASVRVEEYINYFNYEYSAPQNEPFSVHLEGMPDPFRAERHILRVGLQGKEITPTERPSLRLTFLVDVSGSMSGQDKLPMAQRAMHLLVDTLREDDSISLVTYASGSEVILPPTYGDRKEEIREAIDRLVANGSTSMSSGVDLAYDMAWKSFKDGAENRVVVLSDGDANVGNTSWEDILMHIKGYADRGVTLSTIGFGMGNYKDTQMEQLANKGDGNNYYIDSFDEARRLFVDGFNQTMFTIARDVKLQVEFNPSYVDSYRLIGYENRDIADQDFRNDRVDAGEIGAGHNVTALYELVLHDAKPQGLQAKDMAFVRVRYEQPGGDSNAVERVWKFTESDMAPSAKKSTKSLRLAYSVSVFAEILRRSPHAIGISMSELIAFANAFCDSGNKDEVQFLELLAKAEELGASQFISER